MRRTDKEITARSVMEGILQEAIICRVAFCDGDEPYIVPMNFGYENNCLYFHCAPAGRKLEIIKKNPKACFEVDARAQLVPGDKPCSWSMRYFSVIGVGVMSIQTTAAEKRHGLNVIMGKFEGKSDYPFADSALKDLLILKLKIKSMTGKKSRYASWPKAEPSDEVREVAIDDHTLVRRGRRGGSSRSRRSHKRT